MIQGRIPIRFLGAATLLVCSCSWVFGQTEADAISLALVPDGDVVSSEIVQQAPQIDEAPEAEIVRQRFPDGKILVERWVVELASGDIVNHGEFVRYNQAGRCGSVR